MCPDGSRVIGVQTVFNRDRVVSQIIFICDDEKKSVLLSPNKLFNPAAKFNRTKLCDMNSHVMEIKFFITKDKIVAVHVTCSNNKILKEGEYEGYSFDERRIMCIIMIGLQTAFDFKFEQRNNGITNINIACQNSR
jgi:hypothetical protein